MKKSYQKPKSVEEIRNILDEQERKEDKELEKFVNECASLIKKEAKENKISVKKLKDKVIEMFTKKSREKYKNNKKKLEWATKRFLPKFSEMLDKKLKLNEKI